MVYVPTCPCVNVPKTCQLLIFTCQRAIRRARFWLCRDDFSTWRTNILKTVLISQTFLLRNARRNFCTLFLYKKFYIILDIIRISHIKIVIYFISVLHAILNKTVWNFCFLKVFFFLVRNENNIKRPGFYTLEVTRVFSNFPIKQLRQNKNTCQYCDHLE